MKKRKHNLYLLYQFKEPQGDSGQLMSTPYHIVLLFSEMGELEAAELKKVLPDQTDWDKLAFRTKQELLEFSKNCMNQLDFHSVYLLASQDYNIGIESCHDVSAFREIFHRYGEHIADEEKDSKEKNIFGKLF